MESNQTSGRCKLMSNGPETEIADTATGMAMLGAAAAHDHLRHLPHSGSQRRHGRELYSRVRVLTSEFY